MCEAGDRAVMTAHTHTLAAMSKVIHPQDSVDPTGDNLAITNEAGVKDIAVARNWVVGRTRHATVNGEDEHVGREDEIPV